MSGQAFWEATVNFIIIGGAVWLLSLFRKGGKKNDANDGKKPSEKAGVNMPHVSVEANTENHQGCALYCRKCGAKLPSDSLYCFRCGAEVFTGSIIEETGDKSSGVPQGNIAMDDTVESREEKLEIAQASQKPKTRITRSQFEKRYSLLQKAGRLDLVDWSQYEIIDEEADTIEKQAEPTEKRSSVDMPEIKLSKEE